MRSLTFRRTFLVFCCLVLVFTLTMPAETKAWSLFGGSKRNPSVLSASKIDISNAQTITDPSALTDKQLYRKKDSTHAYEIESERTAFTSTYMNRDGTKSLEYSFNQQNYRVGNKWQKINNSLKTVTDPAKPLSLLDKITGTAPAPEEIKKITGKGGSIDAQMKPLSEGLDITIAGKTINMKPLGANNVKPAQKDDHTVVYKDAWNGVDLEYEMRGESVKEIIVLKKKIGNPVFDFQVSGGKVIQHPTRPEFLTVEGLPEAFNFSTLTVDVNGQGVISEERAAQVATNNGIRISLDKSWLQTLKQADFPVRIDPTLYNGEVAASYYTMYKSDGYSCGSSNCYANTGSLYSSGWKSWRTYFKFPYYGLSGKTIINANMHGYYKTGIGGTGTGYPRYLGHANCWGFNCLGTYVGEQSSVGGDFDINFTWRLQQVVGWGDYEAVWSLWGNECGCTTYKPYWDLRATVTYDTPTPMTTPVEPADGQVTVNTQPALRVNSVSDGDNEPVKYYFRIGTSPNAEGGAVINSGWIDSTQWTVPDGILQDGTTYYWHTYTMGARQTDPNWTRSFKIDLRTGKDSTQSYDTVGPIGVNLATGKATTSTGTHTMSALGGSIGLNLDYDSPAKSKNGLIGEYWNVPANYNFASGAPTGTPNLTRNDQDINFDWNLDGPSPGAINTDWFYARWKGYFIAPTTGSYTFGGTNDDNMRVQVNNTEVYAAAYAASGVRYGSSVTLQAGQAVPLQVDYLEGPAAAKAKLYVKGAVAEQPIPRDWLRTDVVAIPSQYGLAGRYYTDDGSHNFPSNDGDPMRLMMARTDSKLNFNWGSDGPAPRLQGDNFLVRWTGYITVPTSGSYSLGASADDGVRIKVYNGGLFGTDENQVLSQWQDQSGTFWGTATNLPGGKAVPITVEYFERSGGASFGLRIQGNGYADQEIPVNWLTPKASALPDAWRLGVDVDGDVNYERLRVVGQNAILEDSTRSTHEYTWTGSGYKPPVNEDGQLTRNSDNTYTLLDTDGKTYTFDKEGKLTSVTTPTDDRSPAALKYIYGGSPSRLLRIEDGVTSGRYGTLHYKGVNEDGNCSKPNGFDDAPVGMLCAFKTSDGDMTKLYYKADQLSRIEKPGGELVDYQYDTLGRITNIRDSLANDAIAANVRVDDMTVMTELGYDAIGRVSAIKAPAPTVGANRINHTFDYVNSSKELSSSTSAGSIPVPGTFSAIEWYGGMIAFARGSSDDLIHKWTTDGINWSNWESLGGCIRGTPSVASWKTGRLDVFARGCNDTAYNIYHRAYEGQWYAWDQPANVNLVTTDSPSVVSWSQGRLDYVVRGVDGKLYHGFYSNGWSGLDVRANCITGSPTIASPADGELDIYALGCDATPDKTVYKHTWRTESGWTDSVAQPEKAVAVGAASLGDSGSMLTYRKADQSAYVRLGDTTQRVSDCVTGVPVAAVKSMPKVLYSQCGATDIRQSVVTVGGGNTRMHITGTPEQNGFSKRVDYDSLLRTTKETDVANLSNTTEWDAVKDLQLSTTDATGLKSTTIYDQLDRAIDNYGPAPAAWFGSDRKPLTGDLSPGVSYTSQIPHTGTGYDEGINGFAISVFNNAKLTGTPKLYTTGFNQVNEPYYAIDMNNATVTPTDGLSFRSTGKIKLNQVGTYTLRLYHGAGARLYVDNRLISDDWTEGGERFSPEGTYVNDTPGKLVSVTIEAHKSGSSTSGGRAVAVLQSRGPGVATYTGTNLYQSLTPAYNLTTSQTAYDANPAIGNVTTTTQYANPAYGTVSSTTLDPGGLNYQSQATYEAPGTGFLRQTSKTLPGGGTTTYQHYSATDARDNPCTTEVESIHQGGRPKGRVEADPDGAGPQASRTSETIYNESGEVVATKYNNDDWTCTEYDSRGRVQRTIIPALGSKPGRTIVNDYAKDGNPLITTTTDDQGTIRVENDLLGRTVKYIDAKGKVTENTYDTYGKLTSRTSPIGTETYEYDNYDRLTVQKLDGVTFATVTYDAFSRLATVQYPAGISLSGITRDTLGRENGTTFTVNGQTYADSIERYVSGDIKQGTENGMTKSYQYDNAGRLTGATIGSNTFAYEFGTPDASCSSIPGYNANAAKNGNRTKMTMNSQVTTYCYDMADRLVSSSDVTLTDARYDSHGNTASLGDATHKTEFGYDASDRNTSIKSDDKEALFTRDAQDRIISREHKENGNTTSNISYGFTGSGDSPDFLLDGNGDVKQKYLTLPGDVLVTIKTDSQSAGVTTYSLPNIHGDIYLTVDADGAVKATHQTGPFGEQLPDQTTPQNTVQGTSWNYVGQHQKLTDTETSPISGGIIQMGARVYVPTLGRFLSVDSVEDGTDNNYAYSNDPLNQSDLDGRLLPILAVVAIQVLPRVTIGLMARVAVRSAVSTATNYVARQAAPVLLKKATAAGSKIVASTKNIFNRATQAIGKGTNYLKSIRVKVQTHAAHHQWKNPITNQKLWYKHINVMIYRQGVSNSQKRIQIPYGKGCIRKNCR